MDFLVIWKVILCKQYFKIVEPQLILFCILGTNYFQKVLGHIGLKKLKISYIVLWLVSKKIRDSNQYQIYFQPD